MQCSMSRGHIQLIIFFFTFAGMHLLILYSCRTELKSVQSLFLLIIIKLSDVNSSGHEVKYIGQLFASQILHLSLRACVA